MLRLIYIFGKHQSYTGIAISEKQWRTYSKQLFVNPGALNPCGLKLWNILEMAKHQWYAIIIKIKNKLKDNLLFPMLWVILHSKRLLTVLFPY